MIVTPRTPLRRVRATLETVIGTLTAIVVFVSLALPAHGGLIPLTSVAGFPNERQAANGDTPPNAIDGNIETFTWTTAPNTVASPANLAIGFSSTSVDRLRLWKSRNGGGGQNIKNLTIQYSTGTGALSSRTWFTVTGLTNGLGGTELLDATMVNSDGTVTGDVHESTEGDGWGSLSFDPVTATGLKIAFANPQVSPGGCSGLGYPNDNCNHYRVGEFEAWTGNCSSDAECNDGNLCNGLETCNLANGECNPGSPPPCDDGNACNGVETCNPSTGMCTSGTAPTCDDGNLCNGVETCNPANGECNPGSPPPCDDGNACNGVETCSPATGMCTSGTAPTCDDGNLCNGVETCNPANGECNPGSPPPCDDGNACNGVETCSPATGMCTSGTAPMCDDGNLCNGVETCNPANGECNPGSPPPCDDGNACNGVETCNPSTGMCTSDTAPACDDGNLCNGVETCNPANGECTPGSPPACDDGSACNGVETCNPSTGMCTPGTPVVCDGPCQICDDGQCVGDPSQNGSACDDDDACTLQDTCSDGTCAGSTIECGDCQACNGGSCAADPSQNGSSCDDGFYCTVNDTCSEGGCVGGGARDCSASSDGCNLGVCNEDSGTCEAQPAHEDEPCSDGNACTSGETCSDGSCAGGSTISCDDGDSCTTDSCDPLEGGCFYDVTVESASCNSCDDGIDNDGDGLADGEEQEGGVCICTTLCKQYRFAATVTFAPTNPKRFSIYSGSDVSFASTPVSAGDSHAGLCGTNAAIRAGGEFGVFAVTGSTDFGKGATLDPELEDPENDVDPGSIRQIDIREQFVSGGGTERLRSAAPLVGPGGCSNDAGLMCTVNADCGMGNSCEDRQRLDTPANPYVDRSGAADDYLRCIAALAAVTPEAAQLSAIAGNVAGLSDGSAQIRTTASAPIAVVNVGAGQQVIYVRRVAISGNGKLQINGTPSTTLLIRIARQLRLGGQAEVELGGGLSADRVLWLAEGPQGGNPKLLRSSKLMGTLMAPSRRGVLVGGQVTIDGAIKSQRLHLGQGSVINHVPFNGLLQ